MIRSILTWALAPLFVLIGLSMALSGVVFATMVGPDDTAEVAQFNLDGATPAFVADLVSTGGPGSVGKVTYGTYLITLRNMPADTFAGIGLAGDVDGYLKASSVRDAGTVVPVFSSAHDTGSGTPDGVAPDQDFWIAHSAAADDATTVFDWNIRRGVYSLLVASSGPDQPLTGTVEIDVRVPNAFISTLGATVLGVLFVAFSLFAMISLVSRGRRRASTHSTATLND
jgi:hypothetical protein